MIRPSKFFRQRGVSIVESAMLIAVVIAVLLVMQFYIKRAINGRWKEAGDVFGYGRQDSSFSF